MEYQGLFRNGMFRVFKLRRGTEASYDTIRILPHWQSLGRPVINKVRGILRGCNPIDEKKMSQVLRSRLNGRACFDALEHHDRTLPHSGWQSLGCPVLNKLE
jgi:hypothetical protein